MAVQREFGRQRTTTLSDRDSSPRPQRDPVGDRRNASVALLGSARSSDPRVCQGLSPQSTRPDSHRRSGTRCVLRPRHAGPSVDLPIWRYDFAQTLSCRQRLGIPDRSVLHHDSIGVVWRWKVARLTDVESHRHLRCWSDRTDNEMLSSARYSMTLEWTFRSSSPCIAVRLSLIHFMARLAARADDFARTRCEVPMVATIHPSPSG